MADLVNVAPGQCRLEYDSATALKLVRKNGAYMPLKISGAWQAKLVPSTPVTLSNAGHSASTRYYIYAFDNAGVLTLEASTTGYVSDTDVGVMIKNGDPTRTLVGLAITNASSQFQVQGKGTLSWFERRRQINRLQTAAYFSGNSAAYTEVSSTLRVEVCCWADEHALGWYNTSGGANSGADQWLAIYLNGSTLRAEQYMGTAATVFGRTGLHCSTPGTELAGQYLTLMRMESATQFIVGNQTSNKMDTVAEVCVMG